MSWRKQESPLSHAPGPSWVPLLTGEAVTAERLTRQAHSALISYPCMSDPTIVGRGWVPFLPISAPPPHPLPMWELLAPHPAGGITERGKIALVPQRDSFAYMSTPLLPFTAAHRASTLHRFSQMDLATHLCSVPAPDPRWEHPVPLSQSLLGPSHPGRQPSWHGLSQWLSEVSSWPMS